MRDTKTRGWIVAIAGFGALALLLLALALRPMTMHGMMWGYGTNYPGGGWGWWGRMALGWLAMIGFWLAIVVVATYLIRRAWHQ